MPQMAWWRKYLMASLSTFRASSGAARAVDMAATLAERKAFAALYKVKRAKAQELKIEGYKIAQHRSLCDVVRTNPADAAALSACWGFGGSGVRLQKYGDMFLAALAPHAAKGA